MDDEIFYDEENRSDEYVPIPKDRSEEKYEIAQSVVKKLRDYADYNGLFLLDSRYSIRNMMRLIR